MSAATLAWLIALVGWIVCITISVIATNHENYGGALFGITMQWVCLGFMWVFLGLSAGWW